jgi:hypothetical protein
MVKLNIVLIYRKILRPFQQELSTLPVYRGIVSCPMSVLFILYIFLFLVTFQMWRDQFIHHGCHDPR